MVVTSNISTGIWCNITYIAYFNNVIEPAEMVIGEITVIGVVDPIVRLVIDVEFVFVGTAGQSESNGPDAIFIFGHIFGAIRPIFTTQPVTAHFDGAGGGHIIGESNLITRRGLFANALTVFLIAVETILTIGTGIGEFALAGRNAGYRITGAATTVFAGLGVTFL